MMHGTAKLVRSCFRYSGGIRSLCTTNKLDCNGKEGESESPAPKLVTAYQSSVQYLFRYTGAFPDSKTHRQWKKQIKTDQYSHIHFDQHLECSSVPFISVEEPYTKGGEYWKLAFLGHQLKLPITLKLPKQDILIFLKHCTVNYFTNGIGIAEMNFEWPPRLPNLISKKETPNEIYSNEPQTQRTTVQSVLDIQRIFLDDDECKIVTTQHETKTEEGTKRSKTEQLRKISVSTKLSELFSAVIAQNIDENPYVLSWSLIEHMSPYFLYNQVLIEPVKELTEKQEQIDVIVSPMPSAPWKHNQLAFWTYIFSTCASSDKIEVKDDFLESFLAKSCYLRWASESGGLWIGYTSHGAAAIHYADTKEDIEKLKKRKSSHNPELMSQLIKPLLFQRAYLQVEINHVRHLINQTANAKSISGHSKISDELKMIEGNLLRFNLIFCDEISEVTAAKAIFEIWQEKLSIGRLKTNLANHVQDLSNFYAGISGEAQKAKLDLLTVIIGCLGLAQLLIQMSASNNASLAAGLTAVSVGGALTWYDQVLRRSETPTDVFTRFTHPPTKRRSVIPKKVKESDIITPRILDQSFSAERVRIISIILFLFGSSSILYSIRNDIYPIDKLPSLEEIRGEQSVPEKVEIETLEAAEHHISVQGKI